MLEWIFIFVFYWTDEAHCGCKDHSFFHCVSIVGEKLGMFPYQLLQLHGALKLVLRLFCRGKGFLNLLLNF